MKKTVRSAMFIGIMMLGIMILGSAQSFAQKRVVVIPFRNIDGQIELNVWRYELADSLRNLLYSMDENEEYYHIVDPDSVEMAISEFNLDPTNVQYESDVWRAVKSLNADKVVQGNFFMRGQRVLINAYVYDVEFQMADQQHQAKNIFKKPDTYMSAVKIMGKKLYPALIKEEDY